MTEFDLFTSLRYDPKIRSASFNTEVNGGKESPYLLIPYHIHRLRSAAEAFSWPLAVRIMSRPDIGEVMQRKCDEAVAGVAEDVRDNGLRLRIVLSYGGELRVEAFPAAPLRRDPLAAAYFNPGHDNADGAPQPIFRVTIDTQPTPASQFTLFKTTSRAHYDAARERVGIKDRMEPREVILYNERGEITEASVRNVSFWRNGGLGWVTPPITSGGLPGTLRRWLMENGLLREEVIRKEDIRPGEWVMMSNSVDGTLLGKVDG